MNFCPSCRSSRSCMPGSSLSHPQDGTIIIVRSSYRLAISHQNHLVPFNLHTQGDSIVKKTTLGIAAELVLGFSAFSAPASAAQVAVPASGISTGAQPGVSIAYVTRRGVGRGPHCTVLMIVRRGPFGRRVVTTKRIC